MKKKLPTNYQEYIAISRYARWLPDKGRRETWDETVARYVNYFMNRNKELDSKTAGSLLEAILSLDVMPSMRAMMTAGEALDRDNVAGYNCSYLTCSGTATKTKQIDEDGIETYPTVYKPTAFDEHMYILMCGTGVGFSVERQYLERLPVIGEPLSRLMYRANNKNFPGVDKEDLSTYDRKLNTIHVADTKYGWASGLRILITELYNGNFNVQWDLSQIRPAGEPLVTFGGRASGPEPLAELFTFCVETFIKANGRRLNSIEVHDVLCKIADAVVVGGVRRSACISLSNLSDPRMRKAKSGAYWDYAGQRANANNSVAYTEKPDALTFMEEWTSLIESKSGERGIFNRLAAQEIASRSRRDPNHDFGTNPCSEIILRDKQFCNLSEVVVRPSDTIVDLAEKVRLATIMGTLQSTLVDFKYLNPTWSENTKEERLLGVSLTGIMDHPIMNGSGQRHLLENTLAELKQVAIDTNKEWAKKLGIPQAASITCVKPSGTVSQLVDSASGIHSRHAPYYLRTVRGDVKDPVTRMLQEQGVPWEKSLDKPDAQVVFSFPMKAPEDAVFRNDRTAIEQLELWKTYQLHWCEHKPSITVYVKEHEWVEVAAWIYEHFDIVSGISLLPHNDHAYLQAPYQDLTEEEYNEWMKRMPKKIDWSTLGTYEKEDHTTSSQEFACVGNSCELV